MSAIADAAVHPAPGKRCQYCGTAEGTHSFDPARPELGRYCYRQDCWGRALDRMWEIEAEDAAQRGGVAR